MADVWWSRNLSSWTRARDANDTSGSTVVLAVAADPHGFVSAGSHDADPAVWTTTNGRLWTTIILALPPGATSAVLQQVAIASGRAVALGREITASGTRPFAELSADGGASWQQFPFGGAAPGASVTALTSGPGGFTAAVSYGDHGRPGVTIWTSATGASWAQARISGLGGAGAGQVTAQAASGSEVTGIGSAVGPGQRPFVLTLPAG